MKRRSPPARRKPPSKALEIVLSEDDLAVIVAAATRARAAAASARPRSAGAPGAADFAGIADLVPPLQGLPGGHSSIRDQVFAAPPPLAAPGVSETIRRLRDHGVEEE